MNDKVPTTQVPMQATSTGSKIAPGSLGEVMKFSEVMSKGDIGLPKHLRGNHGACMSVVMQALEWEMNPFSVASKSYLVNDIIAYESQLIHAVVNTRSGLKNRLEVEYDGEGETLSCKVTGEFENGDVREYNSPPVGAIRVKNSPLWKSDPEQQLFYYASRSWARKWCPEVLLGVYDRDEAESFVGPDNAKDITSTADRLKASKDAQKAQEEPEGFDPTHVASEVESASQTVYDGEIIPAEKDVLPRASQEPESGEGDAATETSSEQTADGNTPVSSSVTDGEDTGPPSETSPSTEDDKASHSPSSEADEDGKDDVASSAASDDKSIPLDPNLKEACKTFFSITPLDVSIAEKKNLLAEQSAFWKGNINQENHPRLKSILRSAEAVLKGEQERGQALRYFAEMLNCLTEDLDGVWSE